MSPKKFKSPEPGKGQHFKPPAVSEENADQRPPIFCLRWLHSEWGLAQCTIEEKAAFADTLYRLSQLTWLEIKNLGRHANGTEKIPHNQIKAGKPTHLTDDVPLLAFRFCAKAPMVGYRDGAVFHILWLDRAFKLYKH